MPFGSAIARGLLVVLALMVAAATAALLLRRRRAREIVIQGTVSQEEPRAVPRELEANGAPSQLPGDGVGPLFHRRYRADIARPTQPAEALMLAIKRDVGHFSPEQLAKFTKTKGGPDMQPGDEYDITIMGPWNGSVRVIDVTPTSFTFVTLEGHPEAGEICFRLMPHPERDEALRFEIVSWARSRDALVSMTYKDARIGREVQKGAWTRFCEAVVEASGGELIGTIEVITEERPFEGEVVPRV